MCENCFKVTCPTYDFDGVRPWCGPAVSVQGGVSKSQHRYLGGGQQTEMFKAEVNIIQSCVFISVDDMCLSQFSFKEEVNLKLN